MERPVQRAEVLEQLRLLLRREADAVSVTPSSIHSRPSTSRRARSVISPCEH
jgi:hypothetical protein